MLSTYEVRDDEETGDYDDESQLVLLERRVAAQVAALSRVPLSMPVPREVVALLTIAPAELDGLALPPRICPGSWRFSTSCRA